MREAGRRLEVSGMKMPKGVGGVVGEFVMRRND
jgi:hypothetical protein